MGISLCRHYGTHDHPSSGRTAADPAWPTAGWLIRKRPMVDITMEKEHVEYQNIQWNDIPNIDIDMEVLIVDYSFQISENIGIITMEKGECGVFTSCFSHVLLHELKGTPVSCICLLVTSGVGGSL